jgi:hypothetical protein
VVPIEPPRAVVISSPVPPSNPPHPERLLYTPRQRKPLSNQGVVRFSTKRNFPDIILWGYSNSTVLKSMRDTKKSQSLTRLEGFLIISIAVVCILGVYLFIQPSADSAESCISSTPHLKSTKVEPRPNTEIAGADATTMSPEPVTSDFNELSSYFPADLRYLRFGLTLAEFKVFEPDLDYKTFEGVRLHAAKGISVGGISEFEAYFELSEPHVYYELIVVFASETQRDQSAAALLGNPNFGKEWLIPLNDQKAIHVWKAFEDKLVYKYLPKGVSSVYDDLPSPEQLAELQRLIEEFKEAVGTQNLEK